MNPQASEAITEMWYVSGKIFYYFDKKIVITLKY